MTENLPGTPLSDTEGFETAPVSHRFAIDSHMPSYHAATTGLLKVTASFIVNVPPERRTLADIIAVFEQKDLPNIRLVGMCPG